jgi:hypothetical protein
VTGVSAVICTSSPARRGQLLGAVESLRSQTVRPLEVLVVVDHAPELCRELRDSLRDVVLMDISAVGRAPWNRARGTVPSVGGLSVPQRPYKISVRGSPVQVTRARVS